jgi:hypothetical protein
MAVYNIPMRTKKWTTKDGTKIRVMDLQTDHLERTIKLIERATNDHIWSMRDVAAALHFDEMLDVWLDVEFHDVAPDIYYDMLEELERRKNESEDRERVRANARAVSAFSTYKR